MQKLYIPLPPSILEKKIHLDPNWIRKYFWMLFPSETYSFQIPFECFWIKACWKYKKKKICENGILAKFRNKSRFLFHCSVRDKLHSTSLQTEFIKLYEKYIFKMIALVFFFFSIHLKEEMYQMHFHLECSAYVFCPTRYKDKNILLFLWTEIYKK